MLRGLYLCADHALLLPMRDAQLPCSMLSPLCLLHVQRHASSMQLAVTRIQHAAGHYAGKIAPVP